MKYMISFLKKIFELMSWVLVILIIGTFYDYYQIRQYAELEKKSISNILLYAQKEKFRLESKDKYMRGGYTKYKFIFSEYSNTTFLNFINDLKKDNYLPLDGYGHGFLCRKGESISINIYPEINKFILVWGYPENLCADSN
ncbi:Uncharacterised protein [Neisseria meningitidis]|uniref:hypothetical protein n=1 Tax=Neisseria meningitidis TaxID=487 RepID=UPI0007665751|nr:hypothetical protein [Neisseria meningitidis]CWM92279.1 Uncharacterised protein [Neisseria meningitidis]CWQ70810.1 Uncharacterised protein [Neisseria meningitidis]